MAEGGIGNRDINGNTAKNNQAPFEFLLAHITSLTNKAIDSVKIKQAISHGNTVEAVKWLHASIPVDFQVGSLQ